MDNPFAGLITRVEEQGAQAGESTNEQRRQRLDIIYNLYTPMVQNVLDQLIAACHPGDWQQASDISHRYCCHATWYAGPQEPRSASYDEHHDLRRMVEITLEHDDQCNPTAFKVTHHGKVSKSVHVGLTRDDLIRGVQDVLM